MVCHGRGGKVATMEVRTLITELGIEIIAVEAEQAGQDGCYSRQLIVAKNRNGPTSDINLLFNPGLTRFENPAKDYRNNE